MATTHDGREILLNNQQLVETIQGVTLNSLEWGRMCLLAAAQAGLPYDRARLLAQWVREAADQTAVDDTIGGMALEAATRTDTCSYCTASAVGFDAEGEPTCGNATTCTAKEGK